MIKRNKQILSVAQESPGYYDIKLLLPVFILVIIGIIMVYSASSVLALKKFGTDYFFLKKQAMFAAAGVIALVICRHFNYRYYKALAYPILIFSIILLLAIHIPGIGYTAGGSARWLHLGGFTIQPSEFARLAMIIYLAYSINKKQEDIKNFYVGFLPHVIVLAIFTLLLSLQPDFGSLIILCALTWTMLFVGGVRILYLASSVLPLLPVAYIYMLKEPYRLRRWISFWDPWQYCSDEGYQIVHSLMAFGTGGIWGTGIGNGYQKLYYLPEPHTDFILSVIGEELGLAGVVVIIILYAFILIRGISIARKTEEPFGALLATGITITIGMQACINMGVTLGLLPTKGLTLPFLSYGGTSLLINMAAVGILMNIGKSAHKNTNSRQV